jgi:glycosyltransferase involved in cell wall biosynthesis
MNEIVHKKNRENLHFLFCGDGPHLNEFRQLTESLDISEYVSLPGRQNEINGILEGCDFAIHPSLGEVGYSLSILEYMWAELPVVVPDNPSVCGATVNGKTGLVYREFDIDSACNSILTLIDNTRLIHTMGRQAKQSVRRDYSLIETNKALANAMRFIYPLASREATHLKNGRKKGRQ